MSNLDDEQIRILRELDIGASLKRVAQVSGFVPSNEKIALAGLHKARIMAKHYFTKQEIKRSKQWLKQERFEIPS